MVTGGLASRAHPKATTVPVRPCGHSALRATKLDILPAAESEWRPYVAFHPINDSIQASQVLSPGGVMRITRPEADEYAPYYGTYINEVTGDCALAALQRQRQTTPALLADVPESRAGHRYAPGKWSLREVIGHVADGERIFSIRLLRFARNDQTPLPSFDENLYVPEGRFERRSLADVVGELIAVRDATLALVRSLDEETMLRRGTASGKVMSVRALAWVMAGHEAHHMKVIGERYLR